MIRLNRIVVGLAALLAMGCASGEDATFAPTGAKGVLDEFGRTIYLDEECGGLDSLDYPEFYQNALLRDGDVHGGTLWLVDGSHLWSAELAPDPDSDVTLKLRLPFVGHGNAVAAAQRYLAVATVERGVSVFPSYNFERPVQIGSIDRAIDVDAQNDWLAVAAGEAGVLIYDMGDPAVPVLVHTIATGGFASGVRWSAVEDDHTLYFSACQFTGYVKFDGDTATPVLSARLGHTNAKDAHGNGSRMAVANNGGGVWFYEMDDMEQSSVYELEDPNFYTNAAYVEGDYAYVAAGNREIVALLLYGDYGDYKPKPVAQLPKDPLGITVDQDIVYGFGNFRDIGERTVVRTTTLSGSTASVLDFSRGLLPWLEPKRFSLWFTDATESEWLVRRETDGYHVYHAALLDRAWQPVPEYKFYFVHGTYAVSVTADNKIRVKAAGAATGETLGDWPDPFPPGGTVTRSRFPGAVLELTWGEGEKYTLILAGKWVLQPWQLEPEASESRCSIPNNQEEGGFSRTVVGGEFASDEVTIEWCSRLVDPYIPGNRLSNDSGTTGKACLDGHCVNANAFESGVVGIVPLSEDEWLGVIDDRSAYTTSLVLWQSKPAEDFVAETASLLDEEKAQLMMSEKHRYVRLGRPEGWQFLAGIGLRVWLEDGSALTYDFAKNAIVDEIAPLDP